MVGWDLKRSGLVRYDAMFLALLPGLWFVVCGLLDAREKEVNRIRTQRDTDLGSRSEEEDNTAQHASRLLYYRKGEM